MTSKIIFCVFLIFLYNHVNGDANNNSNNTQQQTPSSTQIKIDSQLNPNSTLKLSSTSTTAPVITSKVTAVPTNSTTEKCVCDGALLPRIGENGKEIEICPHCKCKYENRNSTLIKGVVIIVIWVISILVIYMLFLMCLDPLLNKRVKANYQEHTNEDDDATSVSGPQLQQSNAQEMNPRGNSSNVLNRVGHQQDKWKRQVREQRKNIYDRRTMLN